jgi:CRP-like cAMP-binding protein
VRIAEEERRMTAVSELTPIDKVLYLQHVGVFKHATTEMLAHIASIAHEVHAEEGAVLFEEEAVSDAMYVVIKGRVRLEKEGREILLVSESESFGTWALFDNQPRLMTATVIENAHLLKIVSDEFYELLADHYEITPVIFRAVIERVRSLVAD